MAKGRTLGLCSMNSTSLRDASSAPFSFRLILSAFFNSKRILFLFLSFALLVLSACSSLPDVYEHSFEDINYTNYTSSVTEEEMVYRMWEFTNHERALEGLHPLQWDADLTAIALAQSQDMIDRGFYDHVNPDGEHPTDRAARQGYPLRKWLTFESYSEGVGENLGQVRPGLIKDFRRVDNTTMDMARAQVELWMKSPEHRKNIMDPNYDKIGMATIWNGSLYLTTQVFW